MTDLASRCARGVEGIRSRSRSCGWFGLGSTLSLVAATSSVSAAWTAPSSAWAQEIEMTRIEAGGLAFDARVAGPEDGPLVFMLHGFPQSSYEWRHQIPARADMGFRVVAPDQRGAGLVGDHTAQETLDIADLAAIAAAAARGQQQRHRRDCRLTRPTTISTLDQTLAARCPHETHLVLVPHLFLGLLFTNPQGL